MSGAVIEAWFDGVCEPKNPGGHGGWGALVKVDGEIKIQLSGYIGQSPRNSNNCAEYEGCYQAMKWILENAPAGVVTIHGDSKLVIYQLAGEWKINGGFYTAFYERARNTLLDLQVKYQHNVRFCWVPRTQNDECDSLSKDELRSRGITFRIQPER